MSDWGNPLWGEVTPDDPAPAPSPTGTPVINSFTGSTGGDGSTTLTVDVTGASTVSISPGIGTVTSPTVTVHPTTTTTFTLTATNEFGTITRTFTVVVGGTGGGGGGTGGENIRFHQIRSGDRHGGSAQIQMSDGTGTTGDIAGFLADGTLTRFQSNIGGDGGFGLGAGAGIVYGQVPRGAIDGNNRFFRLDYEPTSPYMWLVVNGIEQKPPIDGNAANPDPDYVINGNEILYNSPPGGGDWHYVKYYRGDIVVPPPPTPLNATAFLMSAHYPNAGSDQWGGGAGFMDNVSLFSSPSWFRDASQWNKRTDSKLLIDLDFTQLLDHLADNTLYLLVEQFHLGNNAATGTPPFDDEFWIYDSWISIAMSDGSNQIWRPTATATAGRVDNPENAVDRDPTTYAIVRADEYSPGGYDGSALQLYGWIRTA